MKMLRPPTDKRKPGKRSGWLADRARGTRQQRGYGADWQRLRKEILERDGYQCQPCRRRGLVTAADQVDHIKPKARGGNDDPRNLQSICTKCHRTKTASESQGEGTSKSYNLKRPEPRIPLHATRNPKD